MSGSNSFVRAPESFPKDGSKEIKKQTQTAEIGEDKKEEKPNEEVTNGRKNKST